MGACYMDVYGKCPNCKSEMSVQTGRLAVMIIPGPYSLHVGQRTDHFFKTRSLELPLLEYVDKECSCEGVIAACFKKKKFVGFKLLPISETDAQKIVSFYYERYYDEQGADLEAERQGAELDQWDEVGQLDQFIY